MCSIYCSIPAYCVLLTIHGTITKVVFHIYSGRSEVIYGTLKINEVRLPDEGHFYCEISEVNSPAVISDLFPLHVWKRPLDPQITPLGNGTVLEHEEASIAVCSSTVSRIFF